jgi:nucleotide-binding universal stress UspA family protein
MYQRILVPVDGSPTSIRGLDEAIRLGKLTGARLLLVHGVDQLSFATGFEIYTGDVAGMLRESGQQVLAEARARVEAAGVPVETYLSEAFGQRVCELVLEQARAFQAELIVLGTHGRRGVGRLLLGSDAEQIVRIAPVPVLLVRGIGETATAPQAAARGAAAPTDATVAA